MAEVAVGGPGLVLEPVPLYGPAVSSDLRAAVWAEAAVLAACARIGRERRRPGGVDVPVEVTAPGGGRATARCRADGSIEVVVDAGEVLDEVVLRSYCIGRRPPGPGLGGDRGHRRGRRRGGPRPDHAVVRDPPARDMPAGDASSSGRTATGPPVNGSDAVFAAVAARPLAGRRAPAPLAHRRRASPTGAGRPLILVAPAPGKEEA